MFCLDTMKENEQVLNPIGCQCLYKCHGSCLQSWFEQKNQYECPICHTICIMSPLALIPHIVYVRSEYTPVLNDHQKCAGYCCIGLIVWVIVINVVNNIFNN